MIYIFWWGVCVCEKSPLSQVASKRGLPVSLFYSSLSGVVCLSVCLLRFIPTFSSGASADQSARAVKRDVEYTPKCTHPICKKARLKAGYGLVLMIMMITSEERSLMKCSSSKSESSSRPLMVAGPPAGGNFLFLMIILYLRAREEGQPSIFDHSPTCNYLPFRNVVTCSVPKSSKPF